MKDFLTIETQAERPRLVVNKPGKRRRVYKLHQITCNRQPCGKTKWVVNPRQPYCSKSCATLSRPKAARSEQGRKAAAASALVRRQQVIEKYKDLSAGLEGWKAFQAGVQWQIRRFQNTVSKRERRATYAKAKQDAYDEMLKTGHISSERYGA